MAPLTVPCVPGPVGGLPDAWMNCVTSDLSTAMWTCRSVSLLDLLETLNTVLLETLNTVSNWCLKGLYLFSGRWTKTSYLHLRQTGVVCLLK